MILNKKNLFISLGFLGAVAISAALPIKEEIYPHGSAEVVTEEADNDDDLAKYNFMIQMKKEAMKSQTMQCTGITAEELQNLELYSAEVTKQREDIAASDEGSESFTESLQRLQTALNDLSETVNDANVTVSVNDVPTVTSGNLSSDFTITVSDATSAALLAADRIDAAYHGCTLSLSQDNRDALERLVMGEAGNQGFIGAALVAQTIHDTMIKDNVYDVLYIKASHGYVGSLENTPNENVKRAVAFIFDKGGMAVQHELRYFYAPGAVSSDFHEGRMFIVSYGGHKFFSDWE